MLKQGGHKTGHSRNRFSGPELSRAERGEEGEYLSQDSHAFSFFFNTDSVIR